MNDNLSITRKDFKAALERVRNGVGTDDDRGVVVSYCLQETCPNNWQIRCRTAGGYECRVASDILFSEAAVRARGCFEEHGRETNDYSIYEDSRNAD